MGDGRLSSRRRIVDAKRLVPLVDAVQAIGRPDAGSDFRLAALHDLLHDVRIGEMRPRHADHVELAGCYGVPSRRHVGDARGMEHRELGGRPHFAGEVEMRR